MKQIMSLTAIVLALVALFVTPAQAIVHGASAQTTDHTYDAAVALIHNREGTNRDNIFCGGTQIGKRKIITAAHCVADITGALLRSNNTFSVVAGNHDVNKGITARIRTVEVHPSFNSTITHDIAVLTVDRDLPGTPVQLGTATTPVHTTTIAGFGTVAQIGTLNVLPDELQVATVNVISNEQCKSAWGGRAGYNSQLCTQDIQTQADSCDGDSGSGLYTVEDNKLILIGVASFGSTQCGDGTPGVYGSISSHRDWLTSILDRP